MDFNENIYDQIQKYLDGELTGDELRKFESELTKNPDLSGEIELNRQMKDFLADTDENSLRQNLRILNDRVTADPNKSDFSAKYLLWLIPLFLIAGLLFFNSDDEPATPESNEERTVQNQSVETKTEKTVLKNSNKGTEELPAEKPDSKPLQNTVQTPTDEESSPVPKTPQSPKQTEPKKEIPIAEVEVEAPQIEDIASSPASADSPEFEPNPQLEVYVSNPVRNNDFEWKIEQKQEDIHVKSGNLSFQFKAVLKSNEKLEHKTFKLYIFSNDKKQFEDFAPLSSDDLRLNNFEDGAYGIDYQKTLKLNPGLYYYLIEDFSAERIYLAEKFFVR